MQPIISLRVKTTESRTPPVKSPAELLIKRSGQSKIQQRFWEALRFAVFSVTVYLMPLSQGEPEQVEGDPEL